MRSVIIALVLATSTAYAEPVVLAVDGADIYVDLGARDGVGAGSELELQHEIVARDPRSGGTLRDRFALGTLTVAKSGNAVSVAHADEALAKRVLPGDRVVLVSEKRAFVDPWELQVAASKGQPAPAPATAVNSAPSGPPIDHAARARVAWQATLGKSAPERIDVWTQLLASDPQTPYRRSIEAEIASLRAQEQQRQDALARARSQGADDRDPRIARLVAQLGTQALPSDPLLVTAIERAVPGHDVALVFLARFPSTLAHAYLYARPEGAAGYTRSELVRDGDAYLRGTIAAALVRGARVDWYVEIANGQGETLPALGTQADPRSIRIERVVAEAPVEAHRTHIDAHVDYVDFDGAFGKGYDQYYQAELDFAYRFLDPVHAVRLGFGTLSGTGGPKDVIDLDQNCRDTSGAYQCRQVTFSYVYTELELELRPSVALMLRPQAGVLTTDSMANPTSTDRCEGSDIAMCQFQSSFGGRARLRLGREDGTNLVIGAAVSRHVGTLLEAAYQWLPTPVVPVQITVQVTDQPVVEDLGVRLIADVGVRSLGWFYPSVRASYQARDIDHSGVSGGFALNFDW